MPIKKATIALLISLIITIGVCGCMDIVNERIENRIKDDVDYGTQYPDLIKYISEKYPDDTFTFWLPISGTNRSPNQSCYVRSERFPGEMILVVREESGRKNIYFDDYIFFMYKEQIHSLLFELFTEILQTTDFKIRVGGALSSIAYRDFSANTAFEEYISNRDARIHINVALPPDYIVENRTMLENNINAVFKNPDIAGFSLATISFANSWECYDDYSNLSVGEFRRKYSGQNLHIRIFNLGTDDVEFSWREAGINGED